MENKLIIRKAERPDAGLVLDYIKRIAAYEKLEHLVTATTADIEKSLFDECAARVNIAEYEGRTAGFALFFKNYSTFKGKTGIYLEDLFVDEDMRGRGIGKALFQSVAKEAADSGCERMEWACLNWNESSIEFYFYMGATALDEWTTYRLSGDEIRAAAEK